MSRPAFFWRDTAGATAAEFALVAPVAILFLLGIIDIGRYAWTLNQAEKAVQVGARYAVATDIIPVSLNTQNYVGFNCPSGVLRAGDPICREALGTITCAKPGNTVSCTCVNNSTSGSASCPPNLTTVNANAFNRIVHRMQVITAGIQPSRVRVKYSGSGIGYAGDPHKTGAGADLSEVAPVVTVEVVSVPFRAMSLLGVGINLPGFRYSQTLEDGDGAIAY
jgi:hypothetical protein